MAASDLVASTVLDGAASLMNDTAKSVYNYAATLPYLQIALQELRESFELSGIPITEDTSAVIQVNQGFTEIVYNGVGVPSLPSDMVEPLQLWERQRGIDPFVPMTRRQFLPHNLEGILTNNFIYYCWDSQKIKFLASNQDNDIKIDYIRELFPALIDQNTPLNIINGKTFLEYRTAGLCAEFIERNIANANALNAYAVLGMDRVTGISSKSKQTIQTRRRPFRAAYKRSSYF